MHRAVVVGCGGISGVWLKAVAERSDVAVAGLVDISPDVARRRAQEHCLAGAVIGDDLRQVIEVCGADIVFDCTPPHARRQVAAVALERGCYLLMEKPLAGTREDARAIVEMAAGSDRMAAVMQNRRYLAPVRAIQRMRASGALGRLTMVAADFFLGAHFGGFREEMAHVLLRDMAVHTFDMARCMSGEDPVEVWCAEWNPPGSWFAHGAAAVAVFRMTGDVVFSYRGNWCAEGYATSWEGQWRCVFERGSVVWDGGETLRCQKVRDGTGLIRMAEDVGIPLPKLPAAGHAGCIFDFLDCISSGHKPETSVDDNIKTVEMVFSAIDARRRKGHCPCEPADAKEGVCQNGRASSLTRTSATT